MASKAELYEVKFKNKALKSKIEKFKKENEQEKSKCWLYQARCQKAEQILQRFLSLSQHDDRRQMNELVLVQQAIEVLISGASSKSKEQPHPQRDAIPQKRDQCVQIGQSLKEAEKVFMESSNEIKQ